MSEQDYHTSSEREDAMLYQYHPVNQNTLEIRLLKLEPALSWTDEICGSLAIVNLADHPVFEALSYTWGMSSKTEQIKLSNTAFHIAPNLESFLRHRRSETQAVDIWIDAICINQSSNLEKSSQVRLMNLIYAAAAKLIIWLGPEGENSSLAMENLLLYGSGSPYEKMPILTSSVLTAFEHLLTRSWWSRIWIIQEVFWGGAGRKIQDVQVRCGTKEVPWPNIVVAAARMQAHADDQWQHYPAVENILRLEELRNQGEFIAKIAADEIMAVDMVAMYRNFDATDPRDKIYALMGMMFGERRKPYRGVTIDYSMDIRQLYVDFAVLALQTAVGLDVLGHCRSRKVERLPSWVPDWSTSATEKPLPRRKLALHKIEPWWLKSDPKNQEIEEWDKPIFIEEGPGRGLQLNNGLSGDVRKNTITKRFADSCSPEMLDMIKELVDSGHFYMISTNTDDDDIIGRDVDQKAGASNRRFMKRIEGATRRRVESKNRALFADPVVKYAAAGDTKLKIAVDRTANTLDVEGILFDVIDQIHEPFVDNVNATWENSTHLIVAIGECKKISLLDYVGQNPYCSLEEREKAFWLTLFAGRITNNFGKDISIADMPFHEWLPLVPATWVPCLPQVTAVNTGRLRAAEISAAVDRMFNKPDGKFGDTGFGIAMPDAKMLNSLLPEEWSHEDIKSVTIKFQEMASLWHHQPFDLYHRPFSLPTVVPDPFWQIRQSEDKVAILRSKDYKFEGIIVSTEFEGPDGKQWTGRHLVEKALNEMVPIVPEDTLDEGFENFALGRRFFMTKKGYLGLGPPNAKVGDRISVLMGSNLPFVLRKGEGASRGGWEIVGETYVHGIMDGEVIKKWNLGNVETVNLVLY